MCKALCTNFLLYIVDEIPRRTLAVTTCKLIKSNYDVKRCEGNKDNSKILLPMLLLRSRGLRKEERKYHRDIKHRTNVSNPVVIITYVVVTVLHYVLSYYIMFNKK